MKTTTTALSNLLESAHALLPAVGLYLLAALVVAIAGLSMATALTNLAGF